MKHIEKWALSLLLYSFIISAFRHSLWCGLNEACLLMGLVENLAIILAFVPVFIFHKLNVTPEKSFVWNLPLLAWIIYALICNILKIILLTSLTLYGIL